MVCARCITAVREEFIKAGLLPQRVTLGEVDLTEQPRLEQIERLSHDLKALGFEILDDQRKKQIEMVKNLLIAKVQSGEIEEHFSLSHFLSKKLMKEYSQLSRLFSEIEGITLEQFFILQKIEKVKEWLAYNELTLSEISWKLGYSSVAHLSAQFKRITGMTPSEFKKLGGPQRRTIDKV